MSSRPNFLFILTDQFNPRFIGAYGETFPRTPHLDQLAESGTLFESFYCNSPLCVPSRGSMLTGKHVTNAEVYDNGSSFSSSLPTFAHHLARAGYRSILSGKMHLIGPDQLHGFQNRLTTDIYPSSFAWTADWSLGLEHGENQGGVGPVGVTRWNMQMKFDEEVHYRSLVALRELANDSSNQPFLLCVSYTHPHDPYQVSQPFWDLYSDVDIPAPAAPGRSVEQMHPFNQWIQRRHGLDEQPPDLRLAQAARRSYAGNASYIDTKVGELLAELNTSGLAESTVVIFASDHGDMVGEHGMWYKRTFYEDAIRVPLIFSMPGELSFAKRIAAPASLVDLYPTLLAIADTPDFEAAVESVDGKSLLPLMSGKPDDGRLIVSEYCAEGVLHPALILRRNRFKYIYVHDTPPLLFDIEGDPLEQKNLAGNSTYVDVEQEFQNAIPEAWRDGTLERRIRLDQRNRLWIKEAMNTVEYPAWDYQPFASAANQYRRE